jgi:hypothetical protein
MSYSAEVLADSPVGYWRMADSSGTTMAATVGTNGTYSNSPTLGSTGLLVGDSNTAVTFASASSQFSTIPDDGSVDNLSALTVEAWIKPSTVTGITYIVNRDGSSLRCWMFRINAGKLEFIKVAGGTVTVTSSSSLSTGTVYHVAAVYNGTDIRLYINGSLDGTPGSASGTLGNVLRDLEIGVRSAAGYYNGVMDEVAVYASGLSSTRIAAHYTAGSTINGPLASTLDDTTLAASGTAGSADATGTLAATLDDATLAASSAETFTGTLAATLDDATLSATAEQTIAGDLASTLDDTTLDAAGDVSDTGVSGSLDATLEDATLDGTGAESIEGTAESTLDDAALTASGAETITGSLDSTLDDTTLAAFSDETVVGTMVVTLDDAGMAATGAEAVNGTISITLANATLTGAGSETITGTAAVTLDDAALDALATETASGILAATLDDAHLDALGDVDAGSIRDITVTASLDASRWTASVDAERAATLDPRWTTTLEAT